jgi:hypothetical protein
MVVLADTLGRATDVGLTEESGLATLTAAGRGPWRLVVERIGYRTVTAGPLDPAGPGPWTVQIRVPVEPIQLETIEARDDAVCRPDRTGSRSAAVLWDEARKALERVLWTRGRPGHRFDVTLFERRLARGGRVVSEQSSETVSTGLRPFATAPPEWLAEHGFVDDSGEAPIFYGPDAGILLSDMFAGTHCFYVRESGRRLGLAFEPIDEERNDIAGILWLDARTAALDEIEFHYTGPVAEGTPRRPEGRIHLAEIPGGGWIVERWWIRQPLYFRRLNGLRRFSGWNEREGRVDAIDPEEPSGADPEEP